MSVTPLAHVPTRAVLVKLALVVPLPYLSTQVFSLLQSRLSILVFSLPPLSTQPLLTQALSLLPPPLSIQVFSLPLLSILVFSLPP